MGKPPLAISGPLGFQNVPDTSNKSRYEPNQRRFTHMGVSENSVPLNAMVNDHYPY